MEARCVLPGKGLKRRRERYRKRVTTFQLVGGRLAPLFVEEICSCLRVGGCSRVLHCPVCVCRVLKAPNSGGWWRHVVGTLRDKQPEGEGIGLTGGASAWPEGVTGAGAGRWGRSREDAAWEIGRGRCCTVTASSGCGSVSCSLDSYPSNHCF